MGKRCIVHIDMDAFFASVEKLLDPSLEGKPVIVGGLPHERGVASTACYEARKYGVHSGMPLQKAYQLCPNGIFLRGNHRVYASFSRSFHEILSRYTPDIEMASLDESYLDLSRCRVLYPSFSEVSQEIKQTVEKELKLSVSVGVGPNKILARLATKRAKPGGLVQVKPGHEGSFLKELSIEALPGIGPKAQTILHMLNIRKIKDLWGLPQTTLKALFGIKGEEIRLQSQGIDNRPLELSGVQKSISRETTFLKDIWEKRLLLAHLAYLCDRLSLSLRKNKLFGHIIEVKVRWADFKTEARRRLLVNPAQEMDDIYGTAQDLFLELFQGARLSLRLVGVKALDLVRGRTLPLFESYAPHKERLGSAVSEVRERYGFGAVLTGREKMLEEVYHSTKERGFVLKTASLTK